MNSLMRVACPTILIIFSIISCKSGNSGGSASSSSSNGNIAFPSGFAVSSLTKGKSASINSISDGDDDGYKLMATVDSTATLSEKQAAFTKVITAAASADCQIVLPNLATNATNPTCYGPQLDYQNHLDANGSSYDGQLPSGDLGIWSSTGTDGVEACTASKLNALVSDVAAKVDSALLMSAGMICVMKTSGQSLPDAVGAAVDVTSSLKTAVQTNNPTATVTAAYIERLADNGTNPVYKYTVVSSVTSNGSAITNTMHMKHMPTTADNSTYRGKLWNQVSGLPGSNPNLAFSVLYERTATALNYRMVAANYAASPTTVFDSTGNLAVNGSWSGNITQGIFNLSPTTGLGRVSFAWQAGANDDKSRVFNVYTTTSGADTVGCGYFGFGPRFDKTGTALPNNSISTFICNWAGPNNSHTGVAGKAQKQCMKKNSTGVFAVTSNAISYAPIVACSTTADNQTNPNNSGIFRYKVATEASYPGTQTAVTNNLVTLSSDTEYSANYSAPTAPADL